MTTFNYKVRDFLGVTQDRLHAIDLESSSGNIAQGLAICQDLVIGLWDPLMKGTHFPSMNPVPTGFVPMERECIIGREMFLDLMKATFDGPRGMLRLEF